MILTMPGRIKLAEMIKNEPIYLGVGRGDPSWETRIEKQLSVPFAPLGPVRDVKITTIDGNIIHDFSMDEVTGEIFFSEMPTEPLMVSYIHRTPGEDRDAEKLVDEIGRLAAHKVVFVHESEDGDIIAGTKRYKQSDTPTPHLCMEFVLDYDDASTETIREWGIFVGTKADTTVNFVAPKDIQDNGTCLTIEHTLPLFRAPTTREIHTRIISF